MHPTAVSSWRSPGGARSAGFPARRFALAGALLASAFLAACDAGPSTQRAEFFVFGTSVEVLVRGADAERAEKAFSDLGRAFRAMHRDWHPWEPGALTELNARLAEGGWAETTRELAEMARVAGALERRSGGRFNPAVGRLVALWGFHTSDYPITDPPPGDAAIDALVEAAPSMQDLEIRGSRMKSRNPAVQLDFSGLAKGVAARMACERLAERDLDEALVNAGGDVLSCGFADPPWRVAVSNGAGGVLETIEIARPLAVFTSGADYRYREFAGERGAHILDPRTGRPVDGDVQATVVHRNAPIADAAATALVVAAREDWRAVARGMGVERAIVVVDGRVERMPEPAVR